MCHLCFYEIPALAAFICAIFINKKVFPFHLKLSLTQDIKKNEVCEKRQKCENKPLKVYNKGLKNERVVCKTFIIHFYIGGHFLCTLTKVDDIVRKSILELHCLSKVM